MIDFEKLGYKDITKDRPIHFIECLDELLVSTYPYSKRFYKKEGNITIELKVGNYYNTCFISGTCYYSKGWRKFEISAPKHHISEVFTQTLNEIKLKIKRSILELE